MLRLTTTFFNSLPQIKTFRLLDNAGKLLEGAQSPAIDSTLAKKIYRNMLMLPILDNLLNNVQRQGKISFYMTAHGEEATIIGAAAALHPEDE
jgi:2-oxoisovalerate dehydrogenase E1 component alpha subunit